MREQRLLRVSFSNRDARRSLSLVVPAMASGFNVDTFRGRMSVNGEDAVALAELLAQRIEARLAGAKSGRTRRQPRADGRE